MRPEIDNPNLPLLRQVPLFAQLDDSLLVQIATCTRRRRVRADVTLFLRGDPGQTLFIIVSGTVRIARPTAAGRTVHLAQRGPGEHFGEMALIDGKPRMADAVTASACEMLLLDREDFLHCLHQSPQIAVAVMAALAERLREAADQQESHQEQDVLGQLAEALLTEIACLPEGQRGNARLLRISYHRQELAEQIGTTPESVSRAISSLCDARITEKAGRNTLHIINLPKLRERAQASH